MHKLELERLANLAETLVYSAEIPTAWKKDLYQDCVLELVHRQDEEDLQSSVSRIVGKHLKEWKRAAEKDESMSEELMWSQEKELKKLELEEVLRIMREGLQILEDLHPVRATTLIFREAYQHTWKAVASATGVTVGKARIENEKAKKWMLKWMKGREILCIRELL